MTRPSPLSQLMAEPDAVVVAIRKAVASVKLAERAAREDMRTNSTACCDYLALALENLESSAAWMKLYLAEVAADERRVPKPTPKEQPRDCHICGDAIKPADLAICSGCDEPTCPTCMEEETCIKCFAEPE